MAAGEAHLNPDGGDVAHDGWQRIQEAGRRLAQQLAQRERVQLALTLAGDDVKPAPVGLRQALA